MAFSRYICVSLFSLTLSRRGFFTLLGLSGLAGGGGGIPPLPLHNFASIKALTMRLGG